MPRSITADSRAERGFLLVLLWAGCVIGFFALSVSRLEYYSLPALPALALCVGRLWGSELSGKRKASVRSSLGVTWLGLIAFLACLVPAVTFFPRLEHTRFYNLFPLEALPAQSFGSGIPAAAQLYDVPGFARLVPLLEAFIALIVAGAALSAWSWFHRRPRLAFVCLVGAMAAALAMIERGFVIYAPYRSVSQLAALVRAEIQPGDEVVIEGKFEHHSGIAFYTGQPVRVYRGLQGILMNGTRYTGTQGTFVDDSEFTQLWKGPGTVYLLSDSPDSLTRLRALEPQTLVLGRTGNSWLLANRAVTHSKIVRE